MADEPRVSSHAVAPQRAGRVCLSGGDRGKGRPTTRADRRGDVDDRGRSVTETQTVDKDGRGRCQPRLGSTVHGWGTMVGQPKNIESVAVPHPPPPRSIGGAQKVSRARTPPGVSGVPPEVSRARPSPGVSGAPPEVTRAGAPPGVSGYPSESVEGKAAPIQNVSRVTQHKK